MQTNKIWNISQNSKNKCAQQQKEVPTLALQPMSFHAHIISAARSNQTTLLFVQEGKLHIYTIKYLDYSHMYIRFYLWFNMYLYVLLM